MIYIHRGFKKGIFRMKQIFILLITLSATQAFAENKVDDCESFYEIASEVMRIRQSGMDQMEYRNAIKKQFQGKELSRRLDLIDEAYTRQY